MALTATEVFTWIVLVQDDDGKMNRYHDVQNLIAELINARENFTILKDSPANATGMGYTLLNIIEKYKDYVDDDIRDKIGNLTREQLTSLYNSLVKLQSDTNWNISDNEMNEEPVDINLETGAGSRRNSLKSTAVLNDETEKYGADLKQDADNSDFGLPKPSTSSRRPSVSSGDSTEAVTPPTSTVVIETEIKNASEKSSASLQKINIAVSDAIKDFLGSSSEEATRLTSALSAIINNGQCSKEAKDLAQSAQDKHQQLVAKTNDMIAKLVNPDTSQAEKESVVTEYKTTMEEISKSLLSLANLKRSGLKTEESETILMSAHTLKSHVDCVSLSYNIASISAFNTWLEDLGNIQNKFDTTMNALIDRSERLKSSDPKVKRKTDRPLTKNEKNLLNQYTIMKALLESASQSLSTPQERAAANRKAQIAIRQFLTANNPARLERAASAFVAAATALKSLKIPDDAKFSQFLKYGGFNGSILNKMLDGMGGLAQSIIKPLAAGRYASKKMKLASGVFLAIAGFTFAALGTVGLLAIAVGTTVGALITGTLRGLATVVLPYLGMGIVAVAGGVLAVGLYIATTLLAGVASILAAAVGGIVVPAITATLAALRVAAPIVLTVIQAPFVALQLLFGYHAIKQGLILEQQLAFSKQRIEALEKANAEGVKAIIPDDNTKPVTFAAVLKFMFDTEKRVASTRQDLATIGNKGKQLMTGSFEIAKTTGKFSTDHAFHPIKSVKKDVESINTILEERKKHKPGKNNPQAS
jgi:hypothetical protein